MISPADIFQPRPLDGVQAILSAGTNILVGAINNSVQKGRDSVSLRANQENAYLAEQARIEAQNQRRAEFSSTLARDARDFKFKVGTDARDFNFRAKTDARDFNFKTQTDARDAEMRAIAMNATIANQGASASNAASQLDLEKQRIKLEEERLKTQQDKIKEQQDFLKNRGNDLLNLGQPTLLQRLFGGGPSPKDKLPSTPAKAKKEKTVDMQIAELEDKISSYQQILDDPKRSKDLTTKEQADLNLAQLKLKRLKEAQSGGTVDPKNKDPLFDSLSPP